MKLHLSGLFAISAFLLTTTRIADFAASAGHLHIVPANSTKTLYLVGYSQNYSNPKVSCVSSDYKGRDGELVNRTLNFTYDQRLDKGQLIMSSPITVRTPDLPLVFNLEVNFTNHVFHVTFHSNNLPEKYSTHTLLYSPV
uniref:Putative secreted peptide n=1 Tax=Rhipicephalus pulchellus TaxID=72859 RepID=L7MC27_RHIPC